LPPDPHLAITPQLLEYLGKGKSIVDVGLAQARHPLSTRSHYFEVEIVDPGEKCYIALGLARKVGMSAGFFPVELLSAGVVGIGPGSCVCSARGQTLNDQG
jgi:hypothetical protein